MFHIKLEPEPEYMPYMTSISSTSTTFPVSEIFVTRQKVEYHDKLFKLEENFEKLHLNVQNESKIFEENILDNNKGLITKITKKTFLQQRLPYDKDEDEKTFLKCKMCYKPFSKSSKFHTNEAHHYEWLCLACYQRDKMVESFEKLHLDNVQDESEKFFEDKVIDNDEGLITYEDDDNYEEIPFIKQTFTRHYDKDETGKTILKCKMCYKSFKFSIKFKFHAADEVHHDYDWLCLDCCHRDNYERERDVNCILSCSRKFYDKMGLRDHCRSKHPNEVPYNIPRIPLPIFPSPIFFIHESIPNQFLSLFPQFPPYQLKCKICEEIYYTHQAFNSHARLHGYYFSCAHCSLVFRKKQYKVQHERMEHKGQQPHIRCRRLYNSESYREANNDTRSEHPMITRSRKRKMLFDQVVLKMKNCSLNDMYVGETEDNVFMKRIKREDAD